MPNSAPAPKRTWEDDAACRGMDTDLWFGTPDRYGVDRHDEDRLAAAKAICHRCPVREECLEKALDAGGERGVWGETTEEERECLTRRIRRVKCPICAGTTLHNGAALQVCAGCGHSWATTTAQTRVKTDAAA